MAAVYVSNQLNVNNKSIWSARYPEDLICVKIYLKDGVIKLWS